MATAKTNKALQAERMAQAADRLDFLAANARILRDRRVGSVSRGGVHRRASGLHGDPDRRQA